MGLDMYLEKVKRMPGASLKDIERVEQFYYYKQNNHGGYSMEEWCGIPESEVNLELVRAYEPEYIMRYSSWDKEKKYGMNSIFETVADWRKANHIHRWFVDNVQNGIDDCERYVISKENLIKLLDLCKKVKQSSKLIKGIIKNGETVKDGKWVPIMQEGYHIEDPTVAKQLLPVQRGFFFGSTQYDEWYLKDIEYTIEILEKLLKETDFEQEVICYSSSW